MGYLPGLLSIKLGTLVFASSLFGLPSLIAHAADDEGVLEEVKVTGTHIRRPQQRDLASPTQTLSSEDIDVQGAKDIPDIIRNLTINTGAEYQVSGLNQPQTAGTSNFNLRGLGLSSTLVLINGRRQTLSAIAKQDDGSSFVDTNSLVPKIMIERLDILKDGAAATYGTDAIAGVVNFVTYKDYEGGKLELDYQSDTDDGSYNEYTLAGMYGGSLGDDTRYVIAAGYFDRSRLEAGDREWTEGTALSSLANPGAFLTSTGFVPDPACGVNGTFVRSNGLFCGMEITPFFDLVPDEERLSIAANLSHAFSDTTAAYLELVYAKNEGETRATPTYPLLRNFPVVAASDSNNPFGEDVSFFGRVIGPEGSATVLPFEYETWRVAAELSGEFGNGWIWEASANYSESSALVGNADTVISRLQAALAGNGGPAANEFYSPFGSATNSAELLSFLQNESEQDGESSLATVELLVTGDLFATKNGAVAAAFGLQYRDEDLQVDLDDILNADDFYTLPGGEDFSADRDVSAVFAEFNIPLLATLELQLAARYEDYGDEVDSIDPKVAVLWAPSEDVSLRASFGTSFRAPSLLQANGRLGANDVINDSANDLNGLFRTVSTTGNPNLDPEEADVFNLGITLSPGESFEINLDYWRFDYSDLIVKESAQGLVDQAIADFNNGLSDTEALSKVIRVGTTDAAFGFISQINSDFINASSVETDGFDLGANYKWDMNGGSIELGSELTYVSSYDLKASSSASEVDGAGSRNATNFARPVPQLRGNISFAWNYGEHSANLFARYVDSYDDDAADDEENDSHTTVDVAYNYTFSNLLGADSEIKLTVGAVNLFDRDPPELATFIGFDVQTHDPRGRLLYLNLKHAF